MKLVLIGLDGISWNILDIFFKEDLIPNIKRLRTLGSSGTLLSSYPAVTPTAWASIQTGKNPGKHGVFDFVKNCNNNKRMINLDDIHSKILFEILEEHNYSYVAINMPLSDPPRTNNPTIGSIFSTKKILKNTFRYNYNFEKYELFFKNRGNLGKILPRIELHEILINLKNNFNIVKDIYVKEQWDVFFYLFSHTDWMLHKKGIDLYSKNKRMLKDILIKIDEYIGWLIENSPKNTTFIIFSDHGFSYYDKFIPIFNPLIKKGYVKYFFKKYNPSSKRINMLLDKLLIKILKSKLNRFVELINPFVYHTYLKIDLNKSKLIINWCAYCYFIYLNDERYFNAISKNEKNIIKEELLKIYKDWPITLIPKESIYWGNFMNQAPDYILAPTKKNLPILTLNNNILYKRYMSHKQEGFIIMYKENMKHSCIGNVSVYDIAPTILHLLGIKIPLDVDGKVIDIARVFRTVKAESARARMQKTVY